MDRNKRTAVVVLVAVLLASAASLGIYRVVSARPASTGNTVKLVDVVVAQQPLPLGTRLTRDHVKLIKWPAEPEPQSTPSLPMSPPRTPIASFGSS